MLSLYPLVLTRGKLRVVKQGRRRENRSEDRKPKDPGIPSRPDLAHPWPAQDDPREQVAPAPDQGVRVDRRCVQGSEFGEAGEECEACGGCLV